MSVTITDIAAKVGMSKMTVSQALRGVGRVGGATRRRILRTAEELGYRPNLAAKAVSTGRFGCVTLLLGTQPNRSALPGPMLEGIHDALAERGMHLTVAMLPDEALTSEAVVPRVLQNWMADGLIIDYTDHIPRRMIELIRRNALPSIWVNSLFPEDCIRPGDLEAGARAAEVLVQAGHRRIAYFDFSHGYDDEDDAHYSARDRLAGYQRVIASAGLKPIVVRPQSEVPGAERVDFAERWLAGRSPADRPTAAITYGSSTLLPLVVAATRLGMRLPENLALVDFGSKKAIDVVGVRVATLVVPEYEVGRQSVEMLVRKIANPTEQAPARVIQFGFDPGASIVPPAAGSFRGRGARRG